MKAWENVQAFILGESNIHIERIDLSVSGQLAQSWTISSWEEAMNQMIQSNKKFFYGGYLEKRFFYINEALFGSGENKREYHLGLDIWAPANTPIFAPYNSEVFSFYNNDKHLDYGYTLILKHKINEINFYSLYGHLNESSSVKYALRKGQYFPAGKCIGEIGSYNVNGHWPTHLHFQLIIDMEDKLHDYPGVCSHKNLGFYKANCPNPEFILEKFFLK